MAEPGGAGNLLQAIHDAAIRAGLDEEGATVAMAIARTEGALDGSVGDAGQSWGPFQFHTGGQLPAFAKALGVSVAQAGKVAQANPTQAAEWALSGYLGQAIRQGQSLGLRGASLATYAQREGQRSVSPERAGQEYQKLTQGAATSAAVGAAKTGSGQATTGMLATLMARVTQLEADRGDVAQALQEAEAELARLDPNVDFLKADQLQRDVAAKRAQLAKLDTAINQVYGQQATMSRAYDQLLNANQTNLSAQIQAGRLTLDQAKNAWDNVLANAQMLRQVAPMLGTRQMAEGIRQSILNYGKYGAKPVDIGELPLVPLSLASAGGGMLPAAESGAYRQAVTKAVQAGAEPLVLDRATGITMADDLDTMYQKALDAQRAARGPSPAGAADAGTTAERPAGEAMTDREAMGRATAWGLGTAANPYPPADSATPAAGGRLPPAFPQNVPPSATPSVPPGAGPPPPTTRPTTGPTPGPAATPTAGGYTLPPQPPGMSDADYVQLLLDQGYGP